MFAMLRVYVCVAAIFWEHPPEERRVLPKDSIQHKPQDSTRFYSFSSSVSPTRHTGAAKGEERLGVGEGQADMYMYVCMYVRTYVRTYACMHACMGTGGQAQRLGARG